MHNEQSLTFPSWKRALRYSSRRTLRAMPNAIRAVAATSTRSHAARVLAKKLTEKDPVQTSRAMYERPTDRERDVLRYIGQGYSAPEIGQRLFISPKTVDTYKQRIQEKLGFSHRSHYVQFALKLGLLTAL